MGRRSINTTKSGKYMNPTDQARKEARKRELKKNKKQRQMVRAAVLKGKDPLQLINDMEKIDEMEFNVNSPPLLNEKVLKDKRKKLKETWDRVMRLYYKEDRERYNELKKLELEYEARRNILIKYFESVRIAQQVQVDEIPLPDAPAAMFLTSQIPLPSEIEGMLDVENLVLPHSILKKAPLPSEPVLAAIKPPGVPPGPIPDLSSDDEDYVEETAARKKINEALEKLSKKDPKAAKSRKIRFADENDEQEEEEEEDSEDESENKLDKKKEKSDTMDTSETATETANKQKLEDIPVPPMPQSTSLPPGPPPRLPQGPPPNVQVMFRPPPIRTTIPPPPRMLPPGVPPPPPGRPTLPPPGLPIRLGTPPIRLPPGPPPGLPPPRLLRPPTAAPPRLSGLPNASSSTPGISLAPTATAAPPITVLSAPPSLMQRPKAILGVEDAQRSATIEAKPQIRNLSADVMRFMPTTLRVKREDRHKKSGSKSGSTFDHGKDNYPTAAPIANPSVSAPTKDDAYQQFLREMEELL
ncbi:WW domain-binding protein 11 [Parasteatoda tepidariorum]|uniref:WW domain-binding protein 11 n=1 Tax=Parasteatoda tepidariorum TaxID=114398 RepID=UPI001C722793|nr:WW domain-binding protein 11 [Parasteatoda tepidariorum]